MTQVKRTAAAVGIAAALTLTAMPNAEAAAGYRTASNSFTVKSWVGIPVYTMGVKADYYSNGSRITNHYTARANTATHYPGWDCPDLGAGDHLRRRPSLPRSDRFHPRPPLSAAPPG